MLTSVDISGTQYNINKYFECLKLKFWQYLTDDSFKASSQVQVTFYISAHCKLYFNHKHIVSMLNNSINFFGIVKNHTNIASGLNENEKLVEFAYV